MNHGGPDFGHSQKEPYLGGYLSPEHKKTFTIAAGILGVLFFLAQFIIPFVVMIISMPAMMSDSVMNIKEARPAFGAYWQGKVWYPQEQVSPNKTERSAAALMSLPADPLQAPEHASDIPYGSTRLLADVDRLWVIAPKGVGYFRENRFFALPDVQQLGDISRPFLYNNLPAVIEDRPEGLRLMVFRDNVWRSELDFRLFTDERLSRICDLQVLPEGGKAHAFLKYKGTIYFRDDLFSDAGDGSYPWQPVAEAGQAWTGLISGGGPVVFIHHGHENAGITGYRKTGNGWEAFVTHPQFIATSIGAFTDRSGSIILLTETFPGSLNRISIQGSNVTAKTKYGDGFPFPKGFMGLMLIPQTLTMLMPLVLAIIFSALMRKHRVTYYETAAGRKPYASLTRRAFARIIDTGIMVLPLLLVWGLFMSSFFGSDDPFSFIQTGFLRMFAIIIGAFLWMLLCVVIFSIMEGSLGYSPGKRILGIRVLGTDMQLCGFWHALVRNMLMIADGFFNCMVGIMVIALNEHWQRVGDMAAKTVVLDTKER